MHSKTGHTVKVNFTLYPAMKAHRVRESSAL